MQERSAELDSLHFPDPHDPTWAMNGPVRAVEFLSWEEETRMFLARRIYPIYFDFMSYSSCHERWGAVGHMLDAIQTTELLRETIIKQDKYSRRALPFLRESERLNFSSVFSFPVYRPHKEQAQRITSSDIYGAYVVFLKNDEFQPDEFLEGGKGGDAYAAMVEYLRNVSRATAEILDMQGTRLKYSTDAPFSHIWRKTQSGCKDNILFYSIEVEFSDEAHRIEAISSDILSQLALADQFVIRDREARMQSKRLAFLMAPSERVMSGDRERGVAYCKARITEALFRVTKANEVLSIRVLPGTEI
ncbi:MAG: hypothetical protein ABL962_08975 [Fimbriimonadaceae bacterium]